MTFNYSIESKTTAIKQAKTLGGARRAASVIYRIAEKQGWPEDSNIAWETYELMREAHRKYCQK